MADPNAPLSEHRAVRRSRSEIVVLITGIVFLVVGGETMTEGLGGYTAGLIVVAIEVYKEVRNPRNEEDK